MTNETLFVTTLEKFFSQNPYGDLFVKRLEPFCRPLPAETVVEVAERLGSTSNKFPTLKVCQGALEAATKRLAAPVDDGSARPWDNTGLARVYFDARRAAVRIVRGDLALAHKADREGWLVALIDYAADHGFLPPDDRAIGGCIASARKSEDGMHALQGGAYHQPMVRLRTAMLARAAQDVFGQAEAAE